MGRNDKWYQFWRNYVYMNSSILQQPISTVTRHTACSPLGALELTMARERIQSYRRCLSYERRQYGSERRLAHQQQSDSLHSLTAYERDRQRTAQHPSRKTTQQLPTCSAWGTSYTCAYLVIHFNCKHYMVTQPVRQVRFRPSHFSADQTCTSVLEINNTRRVVDIKKKLATPAADKHHSRTVLL